MLDGKGALEKVKEVIIDVDPNDILKDAHEYGLSVTCIEDFRKQADNYVFLEKLASKYGNVAAKYCALSGAGAGIGGLGTAIALAGVDISNMAAQLYRLNQKIAILHGFDPSNEIHQEKVITVYFAALGIDAASSAALRTTVLKAAAENTSKSGPAQSGAIKIIMIATKSLGLTITKGTAAKAVPFIGAALGGGLNYWFAKKASEKILLDYKSDYFDRWQAQNR